MGVDRLRIRPINNDLTSPGFPNDIIRRILVIRMHRPSFIMSNPIKQILHGLHGRRREDLFAIDSFTRLNILFRPRIHPAVDEVWGYHLAVIGKS